MASTAEQGYTDLGKMGPKDDVMGTGPALKGSFTDKGAEQMTTIPAPIIPPLPNQKK